MADIITGSLEKVSTIESSDIQTPDFLAPADHYAVIGTRSPDAAQSTAASHLAFAISIIGNKTIRTGAADGIDKNAMDATGGRNLEVFLPWHSYGRSRVVPGARITVYDPAVHIQWESSVDRYHPAAAGLDKRARAFHACTFGIVHGATAVIAFPHDNSGFGGTAHGIRIAKDLGIPVVQGNKGSIDNAAIFIGKTLQQLGFASANLGITIPGGRNA